MLTRWYRTPASLHKMHPDCSDRCWRCGEEERGLLHLFWSCSRIRPFWDQLRLLLPRFTVRPVPDGPAFFLLHHNSLPAPSYNGTIIPQLVNAAHSCIAEFWKQQDPPMLSRWFQKVNEIRRMEELVAVDMGTQGQSATFWYD